MLRAQIRLNHTTCEATVQCPSVAWLFIGFLTGCARAAIPHTEPESVATSPSTNPSVVTNAELARAAQTGSLMEALQTVRPLFLAARGGTVIVSVDGFVFPDTSILRDIPVADVCTVRLQRATSAAGRSAISPNGRVNSGGNLIDVSLRHDTTCPR